MYIHSNFVIKFHIWYWNTKTCRDIVLKFAKGVNYRLRKHGDSIFCKNTFRVNAHSAYVITSELTEEVSQSIWALTKLSQWHIMNRQVSAIQSDRYAKGVVFSSMMYLMHRWVSSIQPALCDKNVVLLSYMLRRTRWLANSSVIINSKIFSFA